MIWSTPILTLRRGEGRGGVTDVSVFVPVHVGVRSETVMFADAHEDRVR